MNKQLKYLNKKDPSIFLANLSKDDLAEITVSVENERIKGINRFGFPKKLESLYDQEISAARHMHTAQASTLALVAFNLFLFLDFSILADVFITALLIRLLVITPIGILLIVSMDFPSPIWLREGVKAIVIVIVNYSLIYLMAISNDKDAIFYFPGIVLIVTFGNIILRIRFWFAVAASICILITYFLIYPAVPGMPIQFQVTYITVLVTSILMTLFANYSYEKETRHNFILDLHERLRKKTLIEKNTLLAKLSHIDALTGLANRREIDEFIDRITEERISSLAIVMIDIDYFKNFNDLYGHPAGDGCLQKIGNALNKEIHRKRDLVGRYGGEEFVVLLPETSLEDAKIVAERMRLSVKKEAIPHADSSVTGVVSISAGVACGEVDCLKDVRQILSQADTALYMAKESGRDQVQG